MHAMLLNLKRAVRRRVPRTYDWAANLQRWVRSPYERLACRIGRRTGWKVSAGPFAGMKFIRRKYWGYWATRIVGSYEEELHEELERLLSRPFRNIVNIGCADGYYAVGLALRLPQARVLAYETLPHNRRYCEELAALNGVLQRLDIRGTCTVESLAELHLDDTLVVCDCEGVEEDLLDPQAAPWLRKATLVVELHDCYRPNVIQTLTRRFESSHDLKIIQCTGRDPSRYPVLADETPENALLAVKEERITDDGRLAPTPWGIWVPCEST
jgi:hypothetical protein